MKLLNLTFFNKNALPLRYDVQIKNLIYIADAK